MNKIDLEIDKLCNKFYDKDIFKQSLCEILCEIKNPYPENVFIEITNKQWNKINNLLKIRWDFHWIES